MQWFIMQKYKIISILGDGAFGTVYKALNNKTNEVVAIKKMKSKYKSWEQCLELREIKSLRKLTHPNIIKMKEVLLVSQELHLVFEYLDTNLYEQYCNRKKVGKAFTQKQIKHLLFQLGSALAHMHKNGFFHRDLKPENILIAGDILKLCDFGLARQIRSRPPFTDYVSTRWYRAPELLLRSTTYNSPVDVFAFACIAIELYNLSPLFPGNNDTDQLNRIVKVLGTPEVTEWPEGYKFAKGLGYNFPFEKGVNLIELVPTLSYQALDLLRNALKYSSRKRLTMAEVLKHSYFEGVTVESMEKQKQKEDIFFEEKNEGKVLDSSKHQKQLQQFRATKAKFRQTRRHNAQQSDPFKLLEKHQHHKHNINHHSKVDPAEDIDDIIKELEDKKKQRSVKELGYKAKPSREKFYTEVEHEQKDYASHNKYYVVRANEEEPKKYVSPNFEPAFKKEKNIFAYGFQPASLPSLVANSFERNHYSVTPALNKGKGPNISVSNNVQRDGLAKIGKGLFPVILPFRY